MGGLTPDSNRPLRRLTLGAPAFPELLRVIPDPPSEIWVKGSLPEVPCVAIVGSRHATPYGRSAAFDLAAGLARSGVAVVSGLARGIDAAAHRGALSADGITVAVMAAGLDQVYPREHRALAEEILGRGALVSEEPVGTELATWRFPRRNRLIAGFSLVVVVVEAATRSGAFSTVDHALHQGREVMAVPGSIYSLQSVGPNGLIEAGAAPCRDAGDVLFELKMTLKAMNATPVHAGQAELALEAAALSEPARRMLETLGDTPVHIDSLIETTALPAAQAAVLLGQLETMGRVVSPSPGSYQLNRSPAANPRRRS